MMKLFKKMLLVIFAILFLALEAMAAAAPGSCTQTTTENYPASGIRRILFKCTASVDDGSIPVTATSTANTNFIAGWQLFQVDAYPTAGGTAPDAADVFILDENGKDLLGSVDGGTTAYAGANLIHATLAKSAYPDIYITGTAAHAYYFPYITGPTGVLSLKVSNQATHSANYTVVLNFFKDR